MLGVQLPQSHEGPRQAEQSRHFMSTRPPHNNHPSPICQPLQSETMRSLIALCSLYCLLFCASHCCTGTWRQPSRMMLGHFECTTVYHTHLDGGELAVVEVPLARAWMLGSWAIASDAVVAVELGREMGSRVGSGAAKPSLPSSMATRIGGRMDDDDIRVGVGAIGAIACILAARATANKDAVAEVSLSRG